MKTIITSAFVATLLGAGSFVDPASADTIWRYLPKSSTPYAVPHTHNRGGYVVRSASDCPRTVIRRSFRSKVTLVCPDK